MDWFERLMGFREEGYEATRKRIEVDGTRLRSRVTGESYGIGEFELASLRTLRERALAAGGLTGRLKVSLVQGDVRRLHQRPEFAGALFQVASQFNMLEMVGPEVTPEDGVTRYQHDGTQGPACAIAAGAATIYRNYCVPVGGGVGQTRTRQLDGLADLGAALAEALEKPASDLWAMRNGYALCTRAGFEAIAHLLASLQPDAIDALRERLSIGVHHDVEVTEAEGPNQPIVSQAFCSALPMGSYNRAPGAPWQPFVSLVLEAAYEATLWAAVGNAQRGGSRVALLTRLGGGAFGNDDGWIDAAMRRSLRMAAGFDLDVRLVSYGPPSPELLKIAQSFG
jgi:hypothetical protein